MLPELTRLKGIPPGQVLKWYLKKHNINQIALAREINEYPQIISSVIKGKRKINPILSIKLSDYFNVEKDYFSILQVAFDVKEVAKKFKTTSDDNLNDKLRKALFWDVDMKDIDWQGQKKFIIERVFERGNKKEIMQLADFYGKSVVIEILSELKNSCVPNFTKNVNWFKNNIHNF